MKTKCELLFYNEIKNNWGLFISVICFEKLRYAAAGKNYYDKQVCTELICSVCQRIWTVVAYGRTRPTTINVQSNLTKAFIRGMRQWSQVCRVILTQQIIHGDKQLNMKQEAILWKVKPSRFWLLDISVCTLECASMQITQAFSPLLPESSGDTRS